MKSLAFTASVAAALVGVIALGTGAALAQQNACQAYEHPNFRGYNFGLAANKTVRDSKLNNVISSFKVVRGCYVEAFTETNFRGPSVRFTKDTPNLGKWDNIISSYKCICR
jgi:hypothetical protein